MLLPEKMFRKSQIKLFSTLLVFFLLASVLSRTFSSISCFTNTGESYSVKKNTVPTKQDSQLPCEEKESEKDTDDNDENANGGEQHLFFVSLFYQGLRYNVQQCTLKTDKANHLFCTSEPLLPFYIEHKALLV